MERLCINQIQRRKLQSQKSNTEKQSRRVNNEQKLSGRQCKTQNKNTITQIKTVLIDLRKEYASC